MSGDVLTVFLIVCLLWSIWFVGRKLDKLQRDLEEIKEIVRRIQT